MAQGNISPVFKQIKGVMAGLVNVFNQKQKINTNCSSVVDYGIILCIVNVKVTSSASLSCLIRTNDSLQGLPV